MNPTRREIFWTFCACLFLGVAVPGVALCQPPLGTWLSDDGAVKFSLSPQGSCRFWPAPRGGAMQGKWSWSQTSPQGGIMVLSYAMRTPCQTFRHQLRYGIVYLDDTTALLTCPRSGKRHVLRRQSN